MQVNGPGAQADLLGQAELVLSHFPAKGAEKIAARQAAAEVAAAYAAVGDPPDALTFAIVRVLRSAGRHEEALTLLRARRPKLPGLTRQVLFQEMELCLFTGRTEEGDELLLQLQAGGPMRPSWVRSVERIRARESKAAVAPIPAPAPVAGRPAKAKPQPQPRPLLIEDDRSLPLLERVLAINERFPVKEAQKYSVRAAAEQVLADYRAEPAPSHELTYAVIRLLRYLKRYPAALELMTERRPHIAEKAAEVDFYEIDLHLRNRQREVGEALLRKFTEAGHALRPSWKRSLMKIESKLEASVARAELEELQQALCELRTDVDIDTHLPLLRATLPAPNRALELLLFVQGRLQALRQQEAGEEIDLSAFEKYHRARLVFTCGFSWSGSGAVSCFLMQHKQVTLPFGTSEMAYLQGRDGRRGIFPFLSPGVIEPQAMRVLLATFFIESIVSATRPHYSPVSKYLAAEQSRIGTLGELVDDFNAAMLSSDALQDGTVRRRVVAMFLQRLFSLGGGTHVLLNNVFLAPRTALLGAMEDALFVVVERDARDQYVARRIESGHAGDGGVQKFGAMLLKGRANFEKIRRAATPAQLAQQLLLVRFEDFLRDESLRAGLLQRLGLSAEGIVPDLVRFDPRVSLTNVGIHASQLTADESGYLEREVGLYMRQEDPT